MHDLRTRRQHRFLLLFKKLAQAASDFAAGHFSRSHAQSQLFPGAGVEFFLWQQPVLDQKHKTGREGRALVSISEWMVLAKVEKICSGNFEWIDQKSPAHHSCLWRRDG